MSRAPDLPDGTSPPMYRGAQWIGTWWFDMLYRLRVHGREHVPPAGPVVLVANHSAFVDGPLLYGVLTVIGRRPVFLVKHEMFRGPVGWALPRIGQLPVRRGVADRAPLLAAQRVLRGGGLIGVFPEGTRGAGDVAAAQHGAAWLARSTGAIVLPVVVRGTRRPAGVGRRRWRPRVDVLIGAPFTVDPAPGRAGLRIGTEQVRAALVGLIGEVDELRSAR